MVRPCCSTAAATRKFVLTRDGYPVNATLRPLWPRPVHPPPDQTSPRIGCGSSDPRRPARPHNRNCADRSPAPPPATSTPATAVTSGPGLTLTSTASTTLSPEATCGSSRCTTTRKKQSLSGAQDQPERRNQRHDAAPLPGHRESSNPREAETRWNSHQGGSRSPQSTRNRDRRTAEDHQRPRSLYQKHSGIPRFAHQELPDAAPQARLPLILTPPFWTLPRGTERPAYGASQPCPERP